jgi:hypothetical protein
VQPHRAAIRHCPRCVGRNRVTVELFSSTLPADVLYDESSLPRVDGEPVRSCKTARAHAEAGEPARGLAIPRKHLGMELAYALLLGSGSEVSFAPFITSISNEGAGYAS